MQQIEFILQQNLKRQAQPIKQLQKQVSLLAEDVAYLAKCKDVLGNENETIQRECLGLTVSVSKTKRELIAACKERERLIG